MPELGVGFMPKPYQQPRPPIMIGGSRKRVLAFAAREADIVSIANVPFDAVNDAGRTPAEEAVHRLGFVRDAAGDRLPDIDIESSPYFCEVTDDPVAAVERVAELLHSSPVGLQEHPNVLIGSVDQVVDQLQQRRERFGVNYVSVQQAQLASFAPVVARLRDR